MTISTEEKYKALIDALWAKTSEGRIQWEDTSAENAFSTTLAPYTLHISESESRDGVDYLVQIFDAAGNMIDYFTDVNLSRLKPEDQKFTSYFSMMREMHRRAGRFVSGAEKALDNILANLGVSAKETPPDDPEDLPF